MGWSAREHWSTRDPDQVVEARRGGLPISMRRWPWVRSQEAAARLDALRIGLGHRGPVDQDGYYPGGAADEVQPPLLVQWRRGLVEQDSGRPR